MWLLNATPFPLSTLLQRGVQSKDWLVLDDNHSSSNSSLNPVKSIKLKNIKIQWIQWTLHILFSREGGRDPTDSLHQPSCRWISLSWADLTSSVALLPVHYVKHYATLLNLLVFFFVALIIQLLLCVKQKTHLSIYFWGMVNPSSKSTLKFYTNLL